MSISFQTAALIGKSDAERLASTLSEIYGHLVSRGVRVIVEQDTTPLIPLEGLKGASLEQIGSCCDFAVVVGGDGALLSTARSLAGHDIPLIGVNLGRLGFLVDILPARIAFHLDEILDGRYSLEERFMLSANILRGGETIYQQAAINEVVIHRGNTTSMIEIETLIDGAFLNAQRSDGLIVSTPTGSTAYALSAGGPILSPRLKAIVLAPINPHTLSNRPIVVDSDSVIETAFCPCRDFAAQVVCDNVISPVLELGDRVVIKKESQPFRLLHPPGYDFFEILRAKLNWSSGYRKRHVDPS